MLLRLHVKGFKNLRDVEIRFGPLTCFVGTNGVGKSNIFDAIQFLRHLADAEIQRAAEAVRGPAAGVFGPLDLFWGADRSGTMRFTADMIVPAEVVDDFGRSAKPSITILRYEVAFRYDEGPQPRLELLEEDLRHIQIGEAKEAIGFPHAGEFRKAAVTGKRHGGPFISTSNAPGAPGPVITLHQDGGSRGRGVPPGQSPRTVLGGTGGAEHPTVVAARREMSSWTSLHLEPSRLRAPDPFGSPEKVDEHGGHIAATLSRIARNGRGAERTFAEASNRLARLVPEVEEVRVRPDEVHRQHVLEVRLRSSSQWLGPRALSDGTLRFLALVTMEMDADSSHVLCMEEPENGIHPSRVPVLIDLLRDYAVDPQDPVCEDNPLRQVILNSHSPDVIRQLDVPALLFVDGVSGPEGRWAEVHPVAAVGNWRGEENAVPLARVEAVVGGAPLCADLVSRQLPLKFGSAV